MSSYELNPSKQKSVNLERLGGWTWNRTGRLTLHGRMGLRTPVDSTFLSRVPRTIQIIENFHIIQIFARSTEGTGTRPDYMVNRVLTKCEGPHPKTSARKSRNKCRVNSGSVGAHGQLTRGSTGLKSWNQYKRSKNTFNVYCAHLGTPWHQIVGACRTVSNRESRYSRSTSSSVFSAEEVDLSFKSETKEPPQISNPSFWKRDRENVFLQIF